MLGAGSHGTACLVRSVADGQVYVRKKISPSYAFDENNECKDVKYYLAHPNIPRLLHVQEHKLLVDPSEYPPDAASATMSKYFNPETFKSVAAYFDYCNADSIMRLTHFKQFKPSTLFLLKTFDQLLDTFGYLHRNGVAHRDAHMANLFLHFPNDNAPLPDLFVGDYGCASTIPSDIWQDDTHTQLKREPRMHLWDEGVEAIVIDLRSVVQCMAHLLMGVPPIYTESDAEGSTASAQGIDVVFELHENLWSSFLNHQPEGTYPGELYYQWFRLNRMVKRMEGRHFDAYDVFYDIKECVSNLRWEEEQAVKPEDVQNLRWINDSDERRHLDFRKGSNPHLFASRSALNSFSAADIPGPYRIAKVDPQTFTVLGIEKFDHSCFIPVPDFPYDKEYLLPSIRQHEEMGMGEWHNIVEKADEVLDGIAAPDYAALGYVMPKYEPVSLDTIQHYFGTDWDWYPGKTYGRFGVGTLVDPAVLVDSDSDDESVAREEEARSGAGTLVDPVLIDSDEEEEEEEEVGAVVKRSASMDGEEDGAAESQERGESKRRKRGGSDEMDNERRMKRRREE